jgi:hypothetical protein
MDRVFGSRTGVEDAEMLEQARRDVGISYDSEVSAVEATKEGSVSDQQPHTETRVETA